MFKVEKNGIYSGREIGRVLAFLLNDIQSKLAKSFLLLLLLCNIYS